MASLDDLSSAPLFESLDDEQRRQVASWFHVENASEGVRLCGEGCHGYTFFVMTEGTADVTADGELLTTLGPGDYFGEVAILGSGRRTASVTSTSQVRLLVMFGTEFRRLEATYPEIASRLTEAMQARLAGAPQG
jgi:CRP-like cAMP-binding protein